MNQEKNIEDLFKRWYKENEEKYEQLKNPDQDQLDRVINIDSSCCIDSWKCSFCKDWMVVTGEDQNKYKNQIVKQGRMDSNLIKLRLNFPVYDDLNRIEQTFPLLSNCGYVKTIKAVTGDPVSIWICFLIALQQASNRTIYRYHFTQFYHGQICGNRGMILFSEQGIPITRRVPQNTFSIFKQLTLIVSQLSNLTVIIPEIVPQMLLIKDEEIGYRFKDIDIQDSEVLILNTNFIPSFSVANTRYMVELNREAIDYVNIKIIYIENKPYQVYQITKVDSFIKGRHYGAPIFPSFNYYAFIVILLSIPEMQKEIQCIAPLKKLLSLLFSHRDYETILVRLSNRKIKDFTDICNILLDVEMHCNAVTLGLELLKDKK